VLSVPWFLLVWWGVVPPALYRLADAIGKARRPCRSLNDRVWF